MKKVKHATTTLFKVFVLLFIVLPQQTLTLRDAKVEKDGTIQTVQVAGKTLYKKRMTQAEAMYHCETQEPMGRLAVMLSAEEAQSLVDDIYDKSDKPPDKKDLLKKEIKLDLGLSRRYWIGLSDITEEGKWIWEHDGTALSYDEFWTGGQPDHFNTETGTVKQEHCVVLWNPNFDNKTAGDTKHTFNDENCQNKHYFICEDMPAFKKKVEKPKPTTKKPVPTTKPTQKVHDDGYSREVSHEEGDPKRKKGEPESSEELEVEDKTPKKSDLSTEVSHEEGDPRRADGEPESSEEKDK